MNQSLPTIPGQNDRRWYVLNFIGSSYRDLPRKEIDRFNTTCNSSLELFAPTYVVKDESKGELKLRTVNLTFHYVFVRGTFDEVKQLCAGANGFSFLIDRSSEARYAVIDDRQMMHFRNIARAYQNCLPYFSLDDIDLEDGDLVEVVAGDFPGLTGYYMPRAKSKSGNIVLKVFNNVGTIAFNVKASDVRVLEFSRNATRANDQIDAFVPHLLAALRYYHRSEPLPPSLAAKLAVFTGRLGTVRLTNRKLAAKLHILLHAAATITGNTSLATDSYEKYSLLSPFVTNEWTKALITLIHSVLRHDLTPLNSTLTHLLSLPTISRPQQLLLSEFRHFLS